MSNPYFNPVPITGHATARSTEVNALFQGAVAGFEMLPTPTEIKRGTINLAGADSGAANAYVVSLPYNPGSYAAGLAVRFVAGSTNDGASTINVNGIGAAQIRNFAGVALTGGEIVSGAFTDLVYDATNGYFRIINPTVAIGSVSVTNNFKASGTDTTPGTLTDKTAMQGAIVRRVLNAGGNEQHQYKLRETQAVPITANTTLGVGSITSIDTSGGAITALNAPAIGAGDTALQDGDFFTVKDVGGALETNACTINFNGKTCRFMDQSADTTLIMNDNFVEVTCVWDGSADLWIATAIWKA